MTTKDITRLLEEVQSGREGAFDRLVEEVYPVLRQIARARLREQSSGDTLNTVGLVNEAYLRMVRYQGVNWQGRSHFFGAAAQTMRRILINYARDKAAQKRSGERVTLTRVGAVEEMSAQKLLDIDDALERLGKDRPRWVQVVECRYFAGLTIEETAEALEVSHATVSNDWRLARAWLRRELGG